MPLKKHAQLFHEKKKSFNKTSYNHIAYDKPKNQKQNNKVVEKDKIYQQFNTTTVLNIS